MKTFFLLVTVFFNGLALAGGGVDVGNGTSHSVLFHTPNFGTEELLERKLTETIIELNKGENHSFNTVISSGECDKKLSIGSIDQESGFKINDKDITFKRQFQGIIKVNLKNCLKAHLLPNTYGKK